MSKQEKSIRDQLLEEVEEFCAEHGIAESSLGLYALNAGHFMKRVRAGGDMNLKSVERLRAYMRDYRFHTAA